LDLLPGECDTVVFEELAAEGRRDLDAHRYADAAERLARALGLWRGPVLEDLAEHLWIEPYAARLEQTRLAALEDHIEARLRLGQHAEVLGDLVAATAAHPVRERLWGQYMRALANTGRRAQALEAYEKLEALLDAELGVAPSPQLRDLHRQILDGTQPEPARPRSVPALLPPAVADFVGRRPELRRLRRLLAGEEAPRVGLTVAGITGMAGVGKTTLALHFAHSIAPAYPDGQLFANLRGAESVPVDSADVLGRFLIALGVHSRAVPADPDERMELYRTLLAGRRVLVVLDNAASEEQVRPLLPGAPTCAVVITSRSRLTGVEGGRWTELTVLAEDDATQLLSGIVDDARIIDSPVHAAMIVRICGGLPLAVRIAGARLSARPGWSAARLVELLRDERCRLDRLKVGDLEVRASLALSYDGLTDPARRLFRQLSQFDVPDFPDWLAAAVLDGPREFAASSLDALVDAHLLTVVGTDPAGQVRYRFHDLVRIFAEERARCDDGPAASALALRRGLGTWLVIAEQMEPRVPGACYAPIRGGALRPPVGWLLDELSATDPLAWFDAEQGALRSAIRQAAQIGDTELAFDLAQRTEKYFDLRGMYAEWEQTNRMVLAACHEAGNRRGEAVMLRGLIDLTTWITTDHGTEAMTRSYTEAVHLLDLFREVGERGGMVDAAVMCSWALTAMGRHDDAISAATEALSWAGDCGHLGGQARAQVALAVAHGECMRLETAAAHLYQALPPARELGNPRYEATVLQFLGIAHREGGQLDLSERFLHESLEICQRYGDTYVEVLSTMALARVYLQRADSQARATATRALSAAREYQMPHHIADSLGILGEVELAAGRPAEAAKYLRESVVIWRTRGWLRFQASALALLGRALFDLDPGAARDSLDEAHRLFIEVGDTVQAEQTAALRKLL
jgi:tetratricopeptide (TPR) repeat protein